MTIKLVSNALLFIKLLLLALPLWLLSNFMSAKPEPTIVYHNEVKEREFETVDSDEFDYCNCDLEWNLITTILSNNEAKNVTIEELCKEYDVDWNTLHNWRNAYGTSELRAAFKELNRYKLKTLAHQAFGVATTYKSMSKCALISHINAHYNLTITERSLRKILKQLDEIDEIKYRCLKLTPKQIQYIIDNIRSRG